MNTQHYTVKGMSCEHCEASVREEVSEIPGVESIEVSAADGNLSITAQGTIDDQQILAAVEEAGYEATRK